MAEIQDHILQATLMKGDCLFIPSLHYVQQRTLSRDAMLITFTYESASKFATEIFKATEEGILEAE